MAHPYFRFYHRFLGPQLTLIARGACQTVWQTIQRHWRAFVGSYTDEELCRQCAHVAAAIRLPFMPQQMGRHWRATEQIEVGGVNWDEAEVLYGECKWKRLSRLDEREVKKLIERAEQVALFTLGSPP